MRLNKTLLIAAAFAALPALSAFADAKLTGTPLGSTADGSHTWAEAFDGDTSTYFKAESGQFKYVGLDLGSTYVITSIRFTPQSGQESAMTLGIFEGANREDFMDAVPIQMVKSTPSSGTSYLTVQCSRAFRYVRYVGPNNQNCRVAEIEFYGNPGTGDDQFFYQLTAIPTMIINVQSNGTPIVPPAKSEADAEGVHYTIISGNKIDTDEEFSSKKNAYPGSIRIRGNASANWDKKPWKVKFGSKQNPLGLNPTGKANKKWALLSNHGDKTLMRNIVAFDVARKIYGDGDDAKMWTPGIAAVDVVLNGEYQGCYQLAEAENVQKGRVDISEFDIDAFCGTNSAGVSYATVEDAFAAGGFMIEADGYAHQEGDGNYFDTSHYGVGYSYESPAPDDFPTGSTKFAEVNTYVKAILDDLENIAKNGGSNTYETLRQKMHVDDLLRYLMINDICANPDVLWSVKMFKEGTNVLNKKGEAKDSRLHIGPVWDFDLGFANDEYTANPTSHNGFLWDWDATSAADKDALYWDGSNWQWSSDKTAMRYFVHDLFYNNESKMLELMRGIYEEAVGRGLTATYVNELIDRLAKEMNESQKLNFKRWPVLNQKMHREPTLYSTYQEYVDHMKSFVTAEFPHFENLISYTGSTDSNAETIDVTSSSGSNASDWDYTYDIAAANFANVAKGGTLKITLQEQSGDKHETAIFYIPTASDYDHNQHEGDHIMTDRHDGQWSYTAFSGTWTGSETLTETQASRLKSEGLRITCNHASFVSCVYIAPSADSSDDDEEEAETVYNVIESGMTEEGASDYSSWNHKYIITAARFTELGVAEGGKLSISLSGTSGNKQWADYYNKGVDHNSDGSLHIFASYHDGYYWDYADYSNTKTLSEEQANNLKQYGLVIEANGCTLNSLTWTPAKSTSDSDDTLTEEELGERWVIYDLWNCNMDEAEVFIPASFFKNFTNHWGIAVTRVMPTASAAPGRRTATGEASVKLYTRDDSYNATYLQEGHAFDSNGDGSSYFHQGLTTDEVSTLKSQGLYVGGSNYTLYNVEAVVDTENGIYTVVDSIQEATDGQEAWYTIQGIRIDRPTVPGIYIRQQNGRAVKTYVK